MVQCEPEASYHPDSDLLATVGGPSRTDQSELDEKAKQVLDSANALAEGSNEPQTRPEHILLALIDSGFVDEAIKMLGWQPLDLRRATKQVRALTS